MSLKDLFINMITENCVNCPYCDYEQEVPDSCREPYWNDQGTEKSKCNKCGKYFLVRVLVQVSHESIKTPCLNGESHSWKLDYYTQSQHIMDTSQPKRIQMRTCNYCELMEVEEQELKKGGVNYDKKRTENL